jgi:hypothetical protein
LYVFEEKNLKSRVKKITKNAPKCTKSHTNGMNKSFGDTPRLETPGLPFGRRDIVVGRKGGRGGVPLPSILQFGHCIQDTARRKRNVSGVPELSDLDDQTTFHRLCEENLPVKPSVSVNGWKR